MLRTTGQQRHKENAAFTARNPKAGYTAGQRRGEGTLSAAAPRACSPQPGHLMHYMSVFSHRKPSKGQMTSVSDGSQCTSTFPSSGAPSHGFYSRHWLQELRQIISKDRGKGQTEVQWVFCSRTHSWLRWTVPRVTTA